MHLSSVGPVAHQGDVTRHFHPRNEQQRRLLHPVGHRRRPYSDRTAGAVFLAPTPGSFLAAGIPTDTSINLPGTASVAANAATLSTLIPGIVRSFGASHVHIVAHDKGGLDAGEWLSLNAAKDKARAVAPFSVISLTTLSTPHQGTAAADLLVALEASSIQGVPLAALRALGFGVVTPASLDLTTFASPAVALSSPLPSGVDYHSVGGDADHNFNGLVQSTPRPDEYIAERSEQPLSPPCSLQIRRQLILRQPPSTNSCSTHSLSWSRQSSSPYRSRRFFLFSLCLHRCRAFPHLMIFWLRCRALSLRHSFFRSLHL